MITKLTDVKLRGWITKRPAIRLPVPDGTVAGLSIRVGPQAMTWTMKLRVTGEGGVTRRGHPRKGKTHRITLGEYPAVTLQQARGTANAYLDQAKKGINPAKALETGSTSGGLVVEALAKAFIDDYVMLKELKSLRKYQQVIDVHIMPQLGTMLAAMVTRDEVRDALKKAMVKKPRGTGPRDRPRGGKEAARSMISVGRSMFTWGIEEKKINRPDNPFSNMEKTLPKKKKGQRALNLEEAQEAWDAAGDIDYPFGPVYQLDALTGSRRVEWAACKKSYLHLRQGLQIIPADNYKSGHVHVVPLIPEAIEILEWVLATHPTRGEYVFSGTDGLNPISGWSKAHKRLMDAICANTGAYPIPWTPHAIRKFVATSVAEDLGMQGDKLVKKILGHSDKDVTSLYNEYGYVKEVRACLTRVAERLLVGREMRYVLPGSRFARPGVMATAPLLAA
jgi:integrase